LKLPQKLPPKLKLPQKTPSEVETPSENSLKKLPPKLKLPQKRSLKKGPSKIEFINVYNFEKLTT
jgi:hypothetical protein